MANLPELQAEALKWQRRISLISNSGMNPAPVVELARTDLSRIMQGGSVLPEEQVISMVHSAYTGQVTTPSPQTQHGGTDWNPAHIIGNIGKDFTTDIRSAIPGLLHEGADIINPHKWSQLGTALGEFKFGSISDMAKEVAALPVVGPLVPGMFALSAGSSGITHHPLNFLLDVAAVASIGTELAVKAGVGMNAIEGSAMEALHNGHPIQMVARATGIEDQFLKEMQKTGAPPGATALVTEGHYVRGGGLALLKDTQYAHMPIWREYGALSRMYTRKLVDESLTKLDTITGGLSLEEMRKLAYEANTHNPRFESLAVPLSQQNLAELHAASGDVLPRPMSIPENRDIIAYQVGTGAPLDSGVIHLTKADAAKSLPQDTPPDIAQQLVQEVRVSPNDLTVKNGIYSARNILPNKYTPPERVKALTAIREFSDEFSTTLRHLDGERHKPGVQSVVVDNPVTGRTELFPRKSLPVKEQDKYHARSVVVESLQRDLVDQRARIEELNHIVSGKVESYQSLEELSRGIRTPPVAPSVDALYRSSQSFILQGMQDESLRPLFNKLDQAFQSRNIPAIKGSLTTLRRRLANSNPSLVNYLDYMRGKLGRLNVKERAARGAVGELSRATTEFQAAQSGLQAASLAMQSAKRDFYKVLKKTPSDRFHPLVEEQVRAHLKDQELQNTMHGIETIRATTQAAGTASAIRQAFEEYTSKASKIDAAVSREELANLTGNDTFKAVEKIAFRDWQRMIGAGFDPIWVHQISPAWYEQKVFASVHPLSHEFKPSQDRARIFDYSPKVLDIHAQLTHQAMEFMQEEASRDFVDFLIHKSGVVHSEKEVMADLRNRYGDWITADAHINHEFDKWQNPYDKSKKVYLIPKTVNRGLQQYMTGGKLHVPGLGPALKSGHRVFRVAVLTGPRHMVHVAFGGLAMVALREPGALLELAHPKIIFNMLKDGSIPDELSHLNGAVQESLKGTLSKGMYETHVDQMIAYRGGNKMGQWWRQSMVGRGLHNIEQHINNLENTVTDMYRGAVYLDQMKHGATNEAALALVNKTLIDVDNLTPFERTTFRQVFPFWTFTKHILRYVLAYPADHPLRASILAHLALNIEETNGSGDPARLSKLFFLGEPDASGNVKTVDYSNLNPFRSMSSAFSMAGFLSGLAPEYQILLQRFGLNTLTGTPSLHQNFSYDAYTGTNRATRPGLDIFDFAKAYIPQVQILDHFLLFSDTMRMLKQSNPEAYHRALYQEMNLPFAVAPINIYDVRAKAAASQYRDASQVVADAMRTGNTGALRQYVAVPFEGQLYLADQVANYLDYYDQLFQGVSPKAVITKQKRKKTVKF